MKQNQSTKHKIRQSSDSVRLQSKLFSLIVRACILLLFIIHLSSCEKFSEIDSPITQLTASKVYESEATAKAVLSYLYANTNNLSGGSTYSMSMIGSFLADETDLYSTSALYQQMANNQMIPTSAYARYHWENCYSAIYVANALIEGVKNNPNISIEATKQLTGEALFIRALEHLYLACIYGNIPIVTSTEYLVNTSLPQASEKQVFNQVISDLEQATVLLPADYGQYSNERIRPNSFAAKALLARVYLYAELWSKAEKAANDVILNKMLYGLENLEDVFYKNSKETILAYKPYQGFVTGESVLFILVGKPTLSALKSSFYNSFETGDKRKIDWIGKITASGLDYYYPKKYKIRTANSFNEYSILIRLAEVYLIRSEALARQDKISAALADLDVVRERANLSKIAVNNPIFSKTALLNAILQERKSELFTEWSHRWIDLKRFNKLEEVLSPIKPDWQPRAILWPVPHSELLINKNLKQNPGY